MEFTYNKSNKKSIGHKQLKFGVGINDADYVTSNWDNKLKKQVHCPIYRRWFIMLDRCYNKNRGKALKRYQDCTVCNEWLTFSNFAKWMNEQDWKGKDLDKDLLKKGNTVYSPENCIFISKELNTLISKSKKYNITTIHNKNSTKYRAKYGSVFLGMFDEYNKAKDVIIDYKKEVITKYLKEEKNEKIRNSIISYHTDFALQK